WVYTNIDSGEIVANCHKVPQKQFGKILLSVDSIRESLANVIALLKNNNPEINIIFTVSPVRHIKDGFAENQWSKSNLISAVHQALSLNQTYFPSYEIMMDELRDYRFYAEDMLHPNQIAIDYIWERFSETHISTAALSVMEEIGNIQKALAHKPFSPDSAQHRDFLQKLQGRIAELQSRHNHIVF
ncbi:MAG TPA: GSCFA domain-containing protein, partial [Flavobacterium sp.]|nr:GSCFA domain-containing protein [Flavobacterium sp.]